MNWNGRNFLGKFLPGLVSSLEGYDASVVIADNASTDGSKEWLAENFPDIRLIKFRKNHGFTGGYNRAFDVLKDEGYQYYVLINSDIEVTPDWLYPLEEWMDIHDDCGACAPKLLSYSDRNRFEYAGAAGGWIDSLGFPFCRGRVPGRTEEDCGQYDLPEDVMWASGACLMVRASLYHGLRGLDERFFAHMEEIDLCWRMRLEGWRVCCVPRSVVYHVGGGTLANDSPFKLKLNFRNNLLMLENNLAKTYALQCFYEFLCITAGEYEVSADPVTNCLESFDDAGSILREHMVEACASEGVRLMKRKIRRRMLVDRAAAFIYLLKGRRDYYRAVLDAHREFRQKRRIADEDAVVEFLVSDLRAGGPVASGLLDIDPQRRRGDRARIRCVLDGSIVLMEKAYKDKIFEHLRELMQDED